MSTNPSPKKLRQPLSLAPSIKAPAFIVSDCVDPEEDSHYNLLDSPTRLKFFSKNTKVTFLRENSTFNQSLTTNCLSPSLDSEMAPAQSNQMLPLPVKLKNNMYRSKTVVRGASLVNTDFSLGANANDKFQGSAQADLLNVKSRAELSINFSQRKLDGKTFVSDLLTKMYNANGLGTYSPNKKEGTSFENQHKVFSFKELDNKNITNTLIEKYHKDLPITESDLLLPALDQSGVQDDKLDEVELKANRGDSTMRNSSLPQKKEEPKPLKSFHLPPLGTSISLNSNKQKTAIILPSNLISVSSKGLQRHSNKLRERGSKYDLDSNSNQNSKESHRTGASLALSFDKTPTMQLRSMIQKSIVIYKTDKNQSHYDLDIPRERIVRKAMAPDPKKVSSLMLRDKNRRNQSLFKVSKEASNEKID